MIKDILNYTLDKPIYNKITANIWIGNKQSVKNMTIYKDIDVIINCSKNIPFYNTSKINHRISITNDDTMSNKKDLETYLEMSSDLINYHVANNRNILIHCETSVHLSPSIIVAYFIKYRNKNLYEACEFVMNKHRIAFFFNPKFRISLINYEYNILKKNHKGISYIHFKKFKILWIGSIILILIITLVLLGAINKVNTKYTKKNEILNFKPNKFIYDFR